MKNKALGYLKTSFLLSIALLSQIVLAQPVSALTREDAFNLLVKTGFQPTEAEITAYMAYPTREAAVDAVLASFNTGYTVTPPKWAQGDHPKWTNADHVPVNQEFRNWYMAQTIASSSPFTERLSMFWQDHFSTQIGKAGEDAWLIFKHNDFLRKNAVGNFATMVKGVTQTPGMLVFLDQNDSKATPPVKYRNWTKPGSYPTANFARELLELFTLGEGHYTEGDVTNASYALTGLTMDKDTYMYKYDPAMHYDFESNWAGLQTVTKQGVTFVPFLGKPATTPDDVVNIILTEPHNYAAQTVVRKLWQEFVSRNIDYPTMLAIAKKFADPGQYNYEIKPVLHDLLLLDTFWTAKGTLVKSPVEYVVGAIRELGLPGTEVLGFVNMVAFENMPLFNPPNVAGYPTNTNWIDTHTLMERQGHAERFAQLWFTEVFGDIHKHLPLVTDYNSFVAARLNNLPAMLSAPTDHYLNLKDAQQLVMSDPAYYLK